MPASVSPDASVAGDDAAPTATTRARSCCAICFTGPTGASSTTSPDSDATSLAPIGLPGDDRYSIDAKVDRETGRYEVRYKGDEDSPEETLKGQIDLPSDVYNGLLSTLMKNMPAGNPATVQIVAFTPKPRFVKMLLKPAAEDLMQVNDVAVATTRFVVRPQLGLFASLLIADIPDVKCWIAGGEAPAFLRFEGPLYFMGPIWRIDWS